jgi:hypothetical protein
MWLAASPAPPQTQTFDRSPANLACKLTTLRQRDHPASNDQPFLAAKNLHQVSVAPTVP